jgi:pyruvate formate-lyase activating enzyme-like uncharacterized protein
MEFHDVEEYIQYLDVFHFEGIGISGGEPLLAFDRLAEYIREIRKVFGSRYYIWMYTNGDLATGEHLANLSRIGLDEIRFDLAARDYNLAPVKLAAEHIDTVTVEIPAIPEDVETVKMLLKELEGIGVKHLVLHQLMATDYNKKHLSERGYSFCKSTYGTYVPESELAAFEIMKYAIESNSGLGINYCSLHYKEMFQGSASRNRYAPLCRNTEESTTRTGFLRRFSFEDSVEYTVSPHQLERAIMAEPYRPIRVTYYYPKAQALKNEPGNASNVLTFGSRRVSVDKPEYSHFKLENRVTALMFHALFIKNIDNKMTGSFGSDESAAGDTSRYIKSFYQMFGNLEYIPNELPDYDTC